MKASTQLRRKLTLTALTFLIAFLAMTTATFAWYIYNASARTTRVKMVAGSSLSLQISTHPTEGFSSTAVMEKFNGVLTPVSTDKISNGFQKATEFIEITQGQQNRWVTNLFGAGTEAADYYKTTLYLRTDAPSLDLYMAGIGFEDADPQRPISTAMRLGLVIGGKEFVFAVNPDPDPNRGDNADRNPSDDHVLDSRYTDGTTIPFPNLLDEDNFCNYVSETGETSLKPDSTKLCTITNNGADGYGTAVPVDIYLWLEGCDRDCTQNLVGQTLRNLALSFAGMEGA